MPAPDTTRLLGDALQSIRQIFDSPHPDATPGEKLVRIVWVIAALPDPEFDIIIDEAQNRAAIGWASGVKPTDWPDARPAESRR